MAYDKVVDSTVLEAGLSSIADAIREKGNLGDPLMSPLNFPSGFVSAIEGLSGGGATEPYIEETYDQNGNLIDAVMHGYTSIRSYAFQNCGALVSVSGISAITSIGSRTFQNCTNLALTSLPAGITSIKIYSFNNCTGLTTITFEGTPQSINSYAFSGCTNLTTINVPWAEGAVANAPWGATHATINYNYTPEG